MARTINVVGKEGCKVTIHTVNDRMNQKFNEIKASDPRGYMDQWDQRFECICMDIAQELGANFTIIDDVDSEGKPCDGLVFAVGVSVSDALKVMGK